VTPTKLPRINSDASVMCRTATLSSNPGRFNVKLSLHHDPCRGSLGFARWSSLAGGRLDLRARSGFAATRARASALNARRVQRNLTATKKPPGIPLDCLPSWAGQVQTPLRFASARRGLLAQSTFTSESRVMLGAICKKSQRRHPHWLSEVEPW